MTRLVASTVAVAAISVGASLAWVPSMALMFLMPLLAAIQRSRVSAYCVAFTYYAGASWALVPAARNFFGVEPSPAASVILWLFSSTLLAAPWAVAWMAGRHGIVWRLPLGVLSAVLPPLGIIGWASPLTSAGILFPATGWCGLIATATMPGLLVVRPRVVLTGAATFMIFSNLVFTGVPAPPAGWEAVDTHLGGIAHGQQSPVIEFAAAASIQERAIASTAHVIIFPETVVPMWTEATHGFWQQTLAELRASGKTILLGAGRPATDQDAVGVDFSRELAMLGDHRVPPLPRQLHTMPSYRNALVIAGAEDGEFFQRIPVPLGMWKPFSASGVPLNLSGPGIVQLAGHRAAVLICYEQLLTWPIFQSMAERPTVLLAIANHYWTENTPIPRCQTATARAWSRLFNLPLLSATNQ
jgi:hypothetical protein